MINLHGGPHKAVQKQMLIFFRWINLFSYFFLPDAQETCKFWLIKGWTPTSTFPWMRGQRVWNSIGDRLQQSPRKTIWRLLQVVGILGVLCKAPIIVSWSCSLLSVYSPSKVFERPWMSITLNDALHRFRIPTCVESPFSTAAADL